MKMFEFCRSYERDELKDMMAIQGVDLLLKARNFAQPLLDGLHLPSGERTDSHAESVAALIQGVDGSAELQAAVYLAFACDQLNKPKDLLRLSFEEGLADLAIEAQRLFQILRHSPTHQTALIQNQFQIENVRRMLLAFSRDLRVVILLMASQLQNLRYITSSRLQGFESVANETLHIFAPLANRLGIWQMKWELEDLAFRILEPDVYKQTAQQIDAKRQQRESEIDEVLNLINESLNQMGIQALIQGRPKHIYSIVKKMRGKSLQFDQVLDLRAMRIVVKTVEECYQVLSWVHAHYEPLDGEFDDYIAKPKSNGYQSLHTVVKNENGLIFEIQIRTQSMHDHAEFGVAAHWAYKESGVKGYAGVTASQEQAGKMAILRQLLAWERDLTQESNQPNQAQIRTRRSDEKIYVLTPQASIVELPMGATPIDFAYSLHTELGHRCRGAKLDGVLVPLNTALKNGQTVEITTIKNGGPSRDWLNPDLGFMVSHRAKSKVRAWFNAQKMTQTVSRGRELVEKLLQREGKTSLKLDELAHQLGFETANQLFEVVGKDEYSLRHIEALFKPTEPAELPDDLILKKALNNRTSSDSGGVLVVGVDSLLTQLARCCRPAPPDQVKGFVTRGKGISVHRQQCRNLFHLARTNPGRVIDVEWDVNALSGTNSLYSVDVQVIALDRQGLLRDISELFAKEKINVIGVQTQSIKELAWMTFTAEVAVASKLQKVLSLISLVDGVRTARRMGN